jgi:hypothetical protein
MTKIYFLTEQGETETIRVGVVESLTDFKGIDFLVISFFKRPGEDIHVGLDAFLRHTLGDDSSLSFDGPTEQDLSGGLTVLLGNLFDLGVCEERSGLLTIIGQSDERARTERRVGCDVDTLRLNPLNELALLEVRVEFDYIDEKNLNTNVFFNPVYKSHTLKDSRLDLAVGQKIQDKLDVEVGDTNVSDQLGFNKLLKFGPGLVDGRTLEFNGGLLTRLVPSRRIDSFMCNILKRDGDCIWMN